MGELQKGVLAAANSPVRAVLTSIAGGLTLTLVLWMASQLSHVAYALPALDRRVATMEARDAVALEQAAATREALAVLRTQIAGVQEELRMLRRDMSPTRTREP
jgi:hypothetical protein